MGCCDTITPHPCITAIESICGCAGAVLKPLLLLLLLLQYHTTISARDRHSDTRSTANGQQHL
jgi:hypothetical protein